MNDIALKLFSLAWPDRNRVWPRETTNYYACFYVLTDHITGVRLIKLVFGYVSVCF